MQECWEVAKDAWEYLLLSPAPPSLQPLQLSPGTVTPAEPPSTPPSPAAPLSGVEAGACFQSSPESSAGTELKAAFHDCAHSEQFFRALASRDEQNLYQLWQAGSQDYQPGNSHGMSDSSQDVLEPETGPGKHSTYTRHAYKHQT